MTAVGSGIAAWDIVQYIPVRGLWLGSSVKKLNNKAAPEEGRGSQRSGGWCWRKTESVAQLLHQSPGPS